MEVKNIETFVANSVINYLRERDDELNNLKNKLENCCFCSECDDIHTSYLDEFCCHQCRNCKSTICERCLTLKEDITWIEDGYRSYCSEECRDKYKN